MHKFATTQMEFFDLFGGRVRLSPDEYLRLLGTRATQTYLLCVLAILVATDAPGMLGQIPLLAILALWFVVLSAFLICHGLALSLYSALNIWLGRFVLPGALLTLLAITLPILLGQALLNWVSAGQLAFAIYPQMVFYFVIAETFIVIYMRFVRPETYVVRALAAARAEQSEPATDVDTTQTGSAPDTRQILIGAEPVPLRALRHIQAQEHHVHVVLDGTSLTHRARLSDIVAQTAPGDGIQPHRSWWVARHAAQTLERDGQKHVLTLDDGTRVPVARSRVPEVRDWLSERL